MPKLNDVNGKVKMSYMRTSKVLVLVTIMLLLLSMTFRLYHNTIKEAEYEATVTKLTDESTTLNMREAMESVILHSRYRRIGIEEGYLVIGKDTGVVNDQNVSLKSMKESSRFYINDFFFNPITGRITIFAMREDENRSFVFRFILHPSATKFASTIEFDGRNYELEYSQSDKDNNYDPIQAALDINQDGEFDIDYYSSIQEKERLKLEEIDPVDEESSNNPQVE